MCRLQNAKQLSLKFGMDKQFHLTQHNECNYLPMPFASTLSRLIKEVTGENYEQTMFCENKRREFFSAHLYQSLTIAWSWSKCKIRSSMHLTSSKKSQWVSFLWTRTNGKPIQNKVFGAPAGYYTCFRPNRNISRTFGRFQQQVSFLIHLPRLVTD